MINKNILTTILLIFTMSSYAETSMDVELERIRIDYLRAKGNLDAHNDAKTFLNSIENVNEFSKDLKTELLADVDKYKDFKGLVRFADKYFQGDLFWTKSTVVYLLSDSELKKINWPKINLVPVEAFVREAYFSGKSEQLIKSIEKIERGDAAIERLVDHQDIKLKDSTSWVSLRPEYGELETTKEQLDEIRKDLINEKGELLKKYIGASGLELYFEELREKGFELSDHQAIAERILAIELSLSQKQLKALYWPIVFTSLSSFDFSHADKNRRDKRRALRGIKLISVKRSVSKGMRK